MASRERKAAKLPGPDTNRRRKQAATGGAGMTGRPRTSSRFGSRGTKDMFGILGWLFFGLVAGLIAKALMPGRDPGGWIITTVLGIAGAALGGWTGRILGLYTEGEPAGLVMAVVGAIILLVLHRMAFARSPAS